jgi:hypothetical protein
MKVIAILVLCTLINGCVGVMAMGTNKNNYGTNVRLIQFPHKELMKANSPQKISKEDVLKQWGEPQKKVKEDGELERWIYENNLAWRGIILGIIVPIPLIIPTGHCNTSLIFKGDQLIESESVTNSSAAFYCAFGLSSNGPFGCASGGW